MPKPEKIETVELLAKKFSKAKGIYLMDFTGMTVGDAVEFRRRLREQGGIEYRIAKNTLSKIAIDKAGVEGLSDYFVGPTGIIFTYEDPASPAKIIYDFARKKENLQVKICWFDGKILEAEKVITIANLPNRDVLLSQLVSCLQSPLRGFTGVLQAAMQNLIGVLAAVKNQKS